MKNTKEKLKISNKTLIIILSVLVVFFAVLGIAWALLSDKEEGNSQIQIGKINVDLLEDWPEQGEPVSPDTPDIKYDEFGIRRYEKNIQGHSTGDIPAYVRIRCIPIVQYYYVEEGSTTGNWITASIEQEDIVIHVNGDKWVRNGDYYYYKEILNKDEKTDILNIDWQLSELPATIQEYDIRTDVKVILEYAQTANNVWKEVFQINELPEGIELVE